MGDPSTTTRKGHEWTVSACGQYQRLDIPHAKWHDISNLFNGAQHIQSILMKSYDSFGEARDRFNRCIDESYTYNHDTGELFVGYAQLMNLRTGVTVRVLPLKAYVDGSHTVIAWKVERMESDENGHVQTSPLLSTEYISDRVFEKMH